MKVLPGEDAFHLYYETPEQHMHTVAVLVLDPAETADDFSVQTLMDKLEIDLDALPEFRQRLFKSIIPGIPPVLVDDPDFSFRNHVRHIAVPAPGTLRQLSEIIADISGTRLDRNKPLWETWFVSGLANGRIAIVNKNHHCLSDAVNGVEFMAQQFDIEPNPPKQEKSKKGWNPEHESAFQITLEAIKTQRKTQKNISDVIFKAARSIRNRRRVFEQHERAAELVPALMPSAPKLKFNGTISPNRTTALGTVSMQDLKLIKNAFGVTFNDVVLCACTLALRNYLIATDDLPEKPLVCAVPVSLTLKEKDAVTDQSNNVGSMAVSLPVQISDPKESLLLTHESTVEAKRIFDAAYENIFQSLINALSPNIATTVLHTLTGDRLVNMTPPSANLVISNFPGPPMPLYMQGARLEATYPVATVTNGIGLNITCMSYTDIMAFSVLACREKLPAVWDLAEGIKAAVAELKLAAEKQVKNTAKAGSGKKRLARSSAPKSGAHTKAKTARKRGKAVAKKRASSKSQIG